MPVSAAGKPPKSLTYGDSAIIALRAVQTVLAQKHFDPFPQTPLMRRIAKLVNRLPVAVRVGIADWISASIGHPAAHFTSMDPQDAARWVTNGYAGDRYPGLVIGAPGLALTFLCGLTGFPFLPQPLLCNARRDMKLDDAQGYMDAGRELAEPFLEKHPGIEATIHYDPVHDRFLIRRLVFVRLKYLTLPDAYRTFIQRRLVPGAPVILLDCRYTWPRAEVSKRLFFQLGGLGGIPARDYIDETPLLKSYREEWGASPDASWRVDRAFASGPESEWGSTGAFLNEAAECAEKAECFVLRIAHNHPGDLSRLVFNLYRDCWQGSEEPKNAYVGAFTHTAPRFPLVTGSLPLWLPFIADDNLHLAHDILSEWRGGGRVRPSRRAEGTAWVTLHPSFCSPPDIVPLETWRELFLEFFKDVRFLGIDPNRYPFDLGSYVEMSPAVIAAARKSAYPGTPFRKPTASDLARILIPNDCS